jgi:hypothetical protein
MHKSESPDLANLAERGLKVLLFLFGLGAIGLFYFIAFRRLTYPLPLEWAEGGVLDMMRRVASHQPLYVAPSKDFVPFLYTPVYFYIGAALGHLTGVNVVTLRLLSILATTGCLTLIFGVVRRNTGDRFSAWMACCLFAALYGQSTGWFDLARVDMLYLFFLLLAIDLAQRGFSVWSAIAFVVAFQTKQSAAAVAVFVLMHEIRRPRRLIEGLGVFGLGVALSSWVIDRESHGWYRYYTVFLPAHQVWNGHKLVTFLLRDIVDPLGVAIVFVLVGAGLYISTVSKDRGETYFLVFTTIGVTLSSLTARLHMGGSINVTLPLYAWICILFGLCLHLALSQVKRVPGTLSHWLGVATLAACSVQFVHLMYLPGEYVPTASQRVDATRVLNRVSALPGKIFVLHHVIDAGAAGKQGFAGGMELWDVLRADQGEAGQKLKADLIRSFQNHEYAGVLSEGAPDDMLPEEEEFLKDVTAAAAFAYPKQERLLSPSEAREFFANSITSKIKPQFLYVPR